MVRYAKYVLILFLVGSVLSSYAHGGKVASFVHGIFHNTASDSSAGTSAKADESRVAVGFTPGNAESMVAHTIGRARRTIRVAAYSLPSKPIAKALVAAHYRGVDVQVVLDKSQRHARYSSATFLANTRLPVRIDSHYAIMHNNFMVIDGVTVQAGSFNYTRSAHLPNAENVVVLNNMPAVANAYSGEWQRLWKESTVYGPRH